MTDKELEKKINGNWTIKEIIEAMKQIEHLVVTVIVMDLDKGEIKVNGLNQKKCHMLQWTYPELNTLKIYQ